MNQRKFIYIVYRVSQGFGFDVHFQNAFVSEDLAQKYVKFLTASAAKTSFCRNSFSYFIDKVDLISDLSSLGIFFDFTIV